MFLLGHQVLRGLRVRLDLSGQQDRKERGGRLETEAPGLLAGMCISI